MHNDTVEVRGDVIEPKKQKVHTYTPVELRNLLGVYKSLGTLDPVRKIKAKRGARRC